MPNTKKAGPIPSAPAQSLPPRGRLRRGAYLLPSLFTVGNIILGFYAVIIGFRQGNFMLASGLIMLAGIVDTLDGRIARMTGTESEFGKEFDSLADVLTFGAAPAYLAYLWGLQGLGRAGWLIPLFFLICVATRLARFNVQTKSVDNRFFVGLPSPAGAGAIVSIMFWTPDLASSEWPQTVRIWMIAALILSGLLMVSTFRYASFKKVDPRARMSYRFLVVIGVLLLVSAYYPDAIFVAIALLYTTSGPLGWLFGRFRRKEPEEKLGGEISESR